MEPFTVFSAIAAPLDEPNIDTNQLCPTRFNKVPRGPRFSDILLHDRRFNPDGTKKPDFVLNQPPFDQARIIVSRRNFGTGSSRETAVFGLCEFGIRCVIAPTFGDIFRENCAKNGVLAVELSEQVVDSMIRQLQAKPGALISVDLPRQCVVDCNHVAHHFSIQKFTKTRLIGGLDDMALTDQFANEIARFESRYQQQFDWL